MSSRLKSRKEADQSFRILGIGLSLVLALLASARARSFLVDAGNGCTCVLALGGILYHEDALLFGTCFLPPFDVFISLIIGDPVTLQPGALDVDGLFVDSLLHLRRLLEFAIDRANEIHGIGARQEHRIENLVARVEDSTDDLIRIDFVHPPLLGAVLPRFFQSDLLTSSTSNSLQSYK